MVVVKSGIWKEGIGVTLNLTWIVWLTIEYCPSISTMSLVPDSSMKGVVGLLV